MLWIRRHRFWPGSCSTMVATVMILACGTALYIGTQSNRAGGIVTSSAATVVKTRRPAASWQALHAKMPRPTEETQVGTVRLNGSEWHRVGKPFHNTALQNIAVMFRQKQQQSQSNSASLLLYSQQLSGIFRPTLSQYLAVTLDKGIIRVHWRNSSHDKARSIPVTIDNAGPTAGESLADRWCTLLISVTSSGVAAVAQSHMGEVMPEQDLQSSLQQLVSGKQPAYLHVDSGWYIGGVLDPSNILLRKDFKDVVVPFQGSIKSEIVVNFQNYALDGTGEDAGLVDEKMKDYLKTEIVYDLAQPVPRIGNKARDLADPMMVRFPVITGISDNHAGEAEDMIASVNNVMRERGIIVYDLGLSTHVIAQLKKFCNVTVRGALWGVYGGGSRALHDMRWKPPIVHSTMQEFGAVLYADASIRFKKSILDIPVLLNGPGFVGFGPLGTSPTGDFTHEDTLQSLGVKRSEVSNATLTIGGIQIWIDERDTIRDVMMRQWLGCAFSDVCMAPSGSTPYNCLFKIRYTGRYLGCHRYDQSAISVVAWKIFHDRTANSYQLNDPHDLEYASIERYPTSHHPRCLS